MKSVVMPTVSQKRYLERTLFSLEVKTVVPDEKEAVESELGARVDDEVDSEVLTAV